MSSLERYKDIAGMSFGWLTAIEKIGTIRNGAMWRCRCRCGTEVIAEYECLRKGSKVSCGCKPRVANMKPVSLVGQTFGQLTVLGVSDQLKYKQHAVRCRCTCGAEIDVVPRFLVAGRIVSCGCARHRKKLIRPDGR